MGDRLTVFGMGLCVVNFSVVMVLVTEDVRKMLQGAMKTTTDEGTRLVYVAAEKVRGGGREGGGLGLGVLTCFVLVETKTDLLWNYSHCATGSRVLPPAGPGAGVFPRRIGVVHVVRSQRRRMGEFVIFGLLRPYSVEVDYAQGRGLKNIRVISTSCTYHSRVFTFQRNKNRHLLILINVLYFFLLGSSALDLLKCAGPRLLSPYPPPYLKHGSRPVDEE